MTAAISAKSTANRMILPIAPPIVIQRGRKYESATHAGTEIIKRSQNNLRRGKRTHSATAIISISNINIFSVRKLKSVISAPVIIGKRL